MQRVLNHCATLRCCNRLPISVVQYAFDSFAVCAQVILILLHLASARLLSLNNPFLESCVNSSAIPSLFSSSSSVFQRFCSVVRGYAKLRLLSAARMKHNGQQMRPSISLLVIFLLAGFCPAFSQSTISDPGAKQMCAAVKDVELPAADRPTPAEEKALAKCVSADLYFGFGQAADPEKARKCAYAEIDRNDKTPIGGKAILMMVYANGKGATRNFDVAIKLACSIGGAPGDDAGRVYQLDRLKKQNWTGNNFSVCDHSSGREMYEQCAILSERFDKIERDQKFNELIAGWKPAEKKAFQHIHGRSEQVL